MKSVFISALAVLVSTAGASAAIQVADLGTGAPPASIGGYTFVPFGDDARETFQDVSSIGTADGAPFGAITFSSPLNHRQIGDGWQTWSHGYTGDVYYQGVSSGGPIPRGDGGGGTFEVTIGLPANAGAFYFYAEPEPFQSFAITATANDGTLLTLDVVGDSGANGWAFYLGGDARGALLNSITISSDTDFAVGEFGLARVPAPGAFAVAGLAGLVGLRRRR